MKMLSFTNRLVFWIILGLIGYLLLNFVNEPERPRSPFFLLEPFLYSVFILGLWLRRIRKSYLLHFSIFQKHPFISYVIISWFTGMLYELTLSDFGQIGGLHPKTIPSFILAQGFYIPFAIIFLVLTRRYQYTLKEVYFASIAASLTEGVIFNKILIFVILSPFFVLSPFVLGYYGLVYALFTCMPLVFIPEEKLWDGKKRKIGTMRKIVYGFIITFIAYLLFFTWGSLMNVVFNGFKNF